MHTFTVSISLIIQAHLGYFTHYPLAIDQSTPPVFPLRSSKNPVSRGAHIFYGPHCCSVHLMSRSAFRALESIAKQSWRHAAWCRSLSPKLCFCSLVRRPGPWGRFCIIRLKIVPRHMFSVSPVKLSTRHYQKYSPQQLYIPSSCTGRSDKR